MDLEKRNKIAEKYVREIKKICRYISFDKENVEVSNEGSRFFFFHAENEEDWGRCISVTFNGFYYDEEEMWRMFLKVQNFLDTYLKETKFPHRESPFLLD